MSKLSFEEVIQSIADQHGVSVEKVLERLEECIDFGSNNHSPEVKNHWREMAEGKERPTVQNLIAYAAGLVISRSIKQGIKTQ